MWFQEGRIKRSDLGCRRVSAAPSKRATRIFCCDRPVAGRENACRVQPQPPDLATVENSDRRQGTKSFGNASRVAIDPGGLSTVQPWEIHGTRSKNHVHALCTTHPRHLRGGTRFSRDSASGLPKQGREDCKESPQERDRQDDEAIHVQPDMPLRIAPLRCFAVIAPLRFSCLLFSCLRLRLHPAGADPCLIGTNHHFLDDELSATS